MMQFDLTLESDYWIQRKETYLLSSKYSLCMYYVSNIALDTRSKAMNETGLYPHETFKRWVEMDKK